MFNRLRHESRQIMKGVIELVYFMRGAIQYNDMIMMSQVERDMVSDFIKENLEREGKKLHPNY
jgi:hypothetical protein